MRNVRVNQQVKEQTREALIAAAAQAFAESGFHRASIDAVSESAGLAKGTIYNYFPSKRSVFEAVLLRGCELAADAADAIPDDAPTGERLAAFVAGNMEWAMASPAIAILVARELLAGDQDTRELILHASAPCVDKVIAILDGTKLPGPPQSLAVAFILHANSLMLQALHSGGTWPRIEELPRTAAETFLNGVAGDRP